MIRKLVKFVFIGGAVFLGLSLAGQWLIKYAARQQAQMAAQQQQRQQTPAAPATRPAGVLPRPEFSMPASLAVSMRPEDEWPIPSADAAAVASVVATRHVSVESHSSALAQFMAPRIERYYESLASDLGLARTESDGGGFKVRVFRTKEEYLAASGRPEPSVSHADPSAMTVFTYEGNHLPLALPYELSHLMFRVHLGTAAEHAQVVDEGLALVQQMRADENFQRRLLYFIVLKFKAGEHLTLTELFKVRVEQIIKQDHVNIWYAESAMFVSYLIEEKGLSRFRFFLRELKAGKDIPAALLSAYRGEYNDIADLENDILFHIGRKAGVK